MDSDQFPANTQNEEPPRARVCGLFKRLNNEKPCTHELTFDKKHPQGRCPLHCRAKLRASEVGNVYCPERHMRGRRGCFRHGGKTLVGPMAPTYTHGLYSKYLSTQAQEMFRDMGGHNILDLSDDVRLLISLVQDVMKKVEVGESGQRWKDVRNVFRELDDAQRKATAAQEAGALDEAKREGERANEAYRKLGELVRQGQIDWQGRTELVDLVAKKAKIVESQRKSLLEARQLLALQDVRSMCRAIFMSVMSAVEDAVNDPAIRSDIRTRASSEFARLIAPRDPKLVSTLEQ